MSAAGSLSAVSCRAVSSSAVSSSAVSSSAVSSSAVSSSAVSSSAVSSSAVLGSGVDLGLVVDVVVGVDTHADTHTAAFCDGRGAVLQVATVGTDVDGMSALLEVLEGVVAAVDCPRVVFAVEGSGSYGAGLAELVRRWGFTVIEVRKAGRPAGVAKNDANDAVQIARAALRQLSSPDLAERIAVPREGHIRAGLRALCVARDKHVAHKTAHRNQFRAVILTGPTPVRQRLRGLTERERLAAVARMRPRPVLPQPGKDLAAAAEAAQAYAVAQTYAVLAAVAATITHLDETIKKFDLAIDAVTARYAAPLRDQVGVGPITAADLLIGFSHDRFRNEAAFAALAGVAPLEASSGRTTRHRLNRGGDRHLNAALHRIVLTRRCRGHQPTLAYIARRAEHDRMNDKEINRCLKRAVARNMYRILHTLPELP